MPQLNKIEPSKTATSYATLTYSTMRRPTVNQENSILLEPSSESTYTSNRIEPTEVLTFAIETESKQIEIKPTKSSVRTHATTIDRYSRRNRTESHTPSIVTRVSSSITKVTNTAVGGRKDNSRIHPSVTKIMKDIIGTVLHEVIKNGTTATVEMKPKAVRFIF